MSKKTKIIALFGKSGSGKDTALKAAVLNYPRLHKIIPTTTRPKRDYETEGEDYFFINEEEFRNKDSFAAIFQAENSWLYGIDKQNFDKEKLNIGVFTISMINQLKRNKDLEIFPVMISASDKTRIMRTIEREENVDYCEMCRRFLTDESDFSSIPFDYMTMYNEEDNLFIELAFDLGILIKMFE